MTACGPVALTVTFGPSSSPNYRRAVAYALRYADDARELEPGRWRAAFLLEASRPGTFARAGRLVRFVEHWRSTDVEVAGEPEAPWVVGAMAFCAGGWARTYGECRFRYWSDVPPRCRPCPLFDEDRARREIAEAVAEHVVPLPYVVVVPVAPDDDVEIVEVPDRVPEEWTEKE